MALAAAYVAYILWPRWPSAPVSLTSAPLPIMIGSTMFTVEPAAIRMPVQRKPGTQERIDLSYLWPSLTPPDPALKPTVGEPIDPNERLFVTIANGEVTLPIGERVKTIYPRYFEETATAGPPGLTLRGFRQTTPYQNEDMVYDPQSPDHFLARCTRIGVGNSGSCLMERRIGNADVTFRFPRDWLSRWEDVAAGADKLIARLHPGG
ncbi:MAG: hypothetical protein JO237_05820 [Pseudolabrys sp.]|nr:hypothetical protein [Pseudolabrys sp.]